MPMFIGSRRHGGRPGERLRRPNRSDRTAVVPYFLTSSADTVLIFRRRSSLLWTLGGVSIVGEGSPLLVGLSSAFGGLRSVVTARLGPLCLLSLG